MVEEEDCYSGYQRDYHSTPIGYIIHTLKTWVTWDMHPEVRLTVAMAITSNKLNQKCY